jgi:selenocysteine-specific elongation factor
MTTCPLVVIGHVDHGKTALVRALTGKDTDRLPEEKRRGLSIVPGFAHLEHQGHVIDLIDAPGHADFIRAMISGASGACGALLVISAVEGIQAQTLEHMAIAAALGIREAAVAVTKADLLAPGAAATREADLRSALSGTAFSQAPFVFCSAVTGEGLAELSGALAALATRAVGDSPPPGAFLPVDRVFIAEGHGTVVTGTLLGAPVAVNETLALSPDGREVTVRRIQVRGEDAVIARTGERTALNLRGLPAGAVHPGDILHTPGAFAPSREADAVFSLPAGARRPVRHMEDVRVHFGTAQASARLHLFGAAQVAPGDAAMVRLKFRAPVCLYAGQRVILRRLSPAETLGGALLLDPAAPPLTAGKAARLATLAAAQAGDLPGLADALAKEGSGLARLADIARLARRPAERVAEALVNRFVPVGSDRLTPAETIEAAKAAYLASLVAYHAAFPLRLLAPRKDMADPKLAPAITADVEMRLAAAGAIVLTAVGAATAGHAPEDNLLPAQKVRMDEIGAAVKAAGLSAPGIAAFSGAAEDADLLALLIRSGRVIELHNVALNQMLVFHADAIAAAVRTLAEAFPGLTAFTTSEARKALATNRKSIVPLLEHLDSLGVTVRTGDLRHVV